MKRSLLYQVGGEEGVDFETLVEEIQLAEELGADTAWCFPAISDDGSFRGTAPEIWLAGLAARTERIRIGWGLGELLPPGFPPMRTAEQGAVLDVASEGRLEVALLPGSGFSSELPSDIWQEGYRMLVEMWDGPTFSWTSERFEVRPVDVVPKPVQQPHPALCLAGWTAEHATLAGRGGLGFVDLSGAESDVIELHRDAYAESRAESQPEDLVSIDRFAVAADLEPGEEGALQLQAWEELGIDEAIVRVGPLARGHAEAVERIRFLTSAATELH